MPSVVTANELRSGAVVYLADGGLWVEALEQAAIAHDADALKKMEQLAVQAVESCSVTGVYAMDVKLADGRPTPVSVRERIRAAHAPTV